MLITKGFHSENEVIPHVYIGGERDTDWNVIVEKGSNNVYKTYEEIEKIKGRIG